MKRWISRLLTVAIVGFACLAGAANSADCEVDRIFVSLTTTLDDLTVTEREATDSDATEGGVWYIYSSANGQTRNIRRIDIGENFNIETRLSMVDPDTWGISRTFTYYLQQYSSAKPFAIRRTDTSYFFYCDGSAETIDNYSQEENAQYARDAQEVRARFLNAADIADVIKSFR